MAKAHCHWRVQGYRRHGRLKTVCVFDSGVGGLSVLRALLAHLPDVRFVYLADSGHAPYGDRSPDWVQERAHQITAGLCDAFRPEAVVVACNTATALAIDSLRQRWPVLPFVGVEPALKPAVALSLSGQIGVMATKGTVDSARFAALRQRLESTHACHFHAVACRGLADAIERDDPVAIRGLVHRYVQALRSMAPEDQSIDTLVLGCTHYPFVADIIAEAAGPGMRLVDTGEPVARRTRDILGLGSACHARAPLPKFFSTGDPSVLEGLVARWLGLDTAARAWTA